MAKSERSMTIGRRRFSKTERMRNTILKFLRETGGAPPHEVGRALDTTAERTSQLLVRMAKLGEVRFVEGAGVRRDGQACRMYYAVAEKTVSAEALMSKMSENFAGKKAGATPKLQIPKLPKTVFGGLVV